MPFSLGIPRQQFATVCQKSVLVTNDVFGDCLRNLVLVVSLSCSTKQ